MPVDHYENFPVASFLLPKALRAPIEAIYRFARAADDLADEGDASPEARLAALAEFCGQLDLIAAGIASGTGAKNAMTPDHPVFQPLAPVIQQHDLPLACFYDLLSAFAQDVVKTRYADYRELLDYSRRSANPVGRLILALTGQATPENLRQSDAICSALQFINFWQDVGIDWQKGRVYLPQEDLQCFGVRLPEIAEFQSGEMPLTPGWKALMAFQIERSRALMLSGAPLTRMLPGRLGWEIRLTVAGGLRILEKIEAADYDVFFHRPALTLSDWCRMVLHAIRATNPLH